MLIANIRRISSAYERHPFAFVIKAKIKFFFSSAKKSMIFIFLRGVMSISLLTDMPKRKEQDVAALVVVGEWGVGDGQVHYYLLVAFKRPGTSFYTKPK